jgi:NADH-quinone oxidoreductase subunit F
MTNFDEIHSKAKSVYQELEAGSKPWIRIGAAVCGEAAGSREVVDRIKADLSSIGIDANVSEVGCIGLCYAEPIVDVVKPGKPRIFYGNVTPDIASEIVKSYISEVDYRRYVRGNISIKNPWLTRFYYVYNRLCIA